MKTLKTEGKTILKNTVKTLTSLAMRPLILGSVACALLQMEACAGQQASQAGETFTPLIGEANPAKGDLKTPTGSESFEVLLPAQKEGETVSVAKFGASPDNPDNTKAFNDAIAYCAKSGAPKLVAPRGVYRFTKEDSVLFDKLSDFEFDGQNSTFVYNHPVHHFMIIQGCQRTLFKNFSVDWDWDNDPLASIVRVEDVEATGAYADLRFVEYSRFPKRDIILLGSLLAVDPVTFSVGCHDGGGLYYGPYPASPKVEWVSDNVLRLYAGSTPHFGMGKDWFLKDVHKGGFYRLQHRLRGDGAINLGGNVNLTLSCVNVYSCPGAAFFAWGDQHHWQVLNSNVIRPYGTKRAVTSLSDHFDIAQTQGYFKMEGCEISYGGDDCFCVIGGGAIGEKTGPCTIKGRVYSHHFRVGDPVEIRQDDYTPTGFTAKIIAFKVIDQQNGISELTFEKPLPEQKGQTLILFNRHNNPKNFIIRNCFFHDNQARGVLLKGENITMENCRLLHNQLGAIHVYTGYRLADGADGCGASNIVIRNNLIENANPDERYKEGKMPAVYLFSYIRACKGDTPLRREDKTKFPIISDVLIEKNQFVDFPGTIVSLCSANNVIIRDNLIKVTKSQAGDLPYRGSIEASFASDVFAIGNKWVKSPYMGTPGLFIDKETTDGIFWDANEILENAPAK